MKRILLFCCVFFVAISAQSQYNNSILVEKILKSDTTSIGQKIIYPRVSDAEVTIAKITFPPGSETGWHKHDIPVFAYVMEGELTVELDNGKSVQFKQGSSFAEVFDTWHNGKNNGTGNLVLIAVYMGEKGKSLSKSRN